MKLPQKIAQTVSTAILVVFCGAFLIFGISATGWKALAIPTGSMRPTIPPGSLVLVHRVPISSLKIGDVITYINPLNPRTTLSHRIVKKYLINNKVPAFITKGDANKTDDVPIAAGNIQGRVVWHINEAGYMLLDAKKPMIILPIIYTIAIIIMAEEVKRLSDYFKLSQPYRTPIARRFKKQPRLLFNNLKVGLIIAGIFIVIGVGVGTSPVEALLRSNTVALTGNSLAVASTTNQCSGSSSNNTSITVNNNNSQTSTSGNVNNSSSGSSSSGNASNNNSSNVNINVNNC